MEYHGEHPEEIRQMMIKLILDEKYIYLSEKYDYLDHFLSESTEGYTQLTFENKKIFKNRFLMNANDYMLGEVYSFGWSEDGVRITFYEFIDENIDAVESMMDDIQEIDRD